MGLYEALVVLQDVLVLEGYPQPGFGVPEDALRGPFPSWYIDLPPESFEYELIQSASPTRTRAVVSLYIFLHENNLPTGEDSMFRHLTKTVVPTVRSLLEAAAVARRFADDGGAGSEVSIMSVAYDWRPKLPVAGIKVDLEIRAYA